MNSSNGTFTPIELQVTNLDQNIDPKDMKRILSSIFMEHVMVIQFFDTQKNTKEKRKIHFNQLINNYDIFKKI